MIRAPLDASLTLVQAYAFPARRQAVSVGAAGCAISVSETTPAAEAAGELLTLLIEQITLILREAARRSSGAADSVRSAAFR